MDIAFRVVCSHLAKSNVNQIKETCTAPGYSGDLVCKIASCGHREQGHTTAPLGHNYVDGVCTRCHEKTASAVISAPTGDLAHPGRWIAALCLTGGMIAALIVARKKEKE